MRVAIIPARGGSKRIPRKNIKPFCGKPIMSYSVEAALESTLFDRVVVSTDDDEIAQVARSFGAEIPFMRPAELSDDYTGTMDVMKHAICELALEGAKVSHACCIHATAPFVTAKNLLAGWKLLEDTQADFVFSVTSFGYPIQRAFRINDNRRISMFYPEFYEMRSQDLEHAFHDAGQFYWGLAEAFLGNQPLFGENSAPLVLPRWRVQDIDTMEDWHMAELMFDALNQRVGIFDENNLPS